MNKRSFFPAAVMLSLFLVFGSICTPVMAASTDHDLSIGFTAVDDSGNTVANFPYGYTVSVSAVTESGDPLTGTYNITGATVSTVTFTDGKCGIEILPGSTATFQGLPDNTTVTVRPIRRIRTDGSTDSIYEKISTTDLDSNNSLILDSDKSISYTVDSKSIYTSISILPTFYKDSWTDDCEYLFHMTFWDEHGLDLSEFSYTIEGDATVYKPTSENNNLIIDVKVPMNKKLTINGIPTGIHFSNYDFSDSEEHHLYWKGNVQNLSGTFFATTTSTGYKYLSSGIMDLTYSGLWTIYYSRRAVMASVTKFVADPSLANDDNLYDFKVTLYDTVHDRPHTGKVQVITGPYQSVQSYSQIYGPAQLPSDLTLRLAETDENGSFYISLKRNEMALIGKNYDFEMTNAPWVVLNLNSSEIYHTEYDNYNPEDGMIPALTKITIEEVGDGYQVLSGPNTPTDKFVEWTPEYAQEMNFQCVNTRTFDSSLNLKKVVEGKNGEFDFTIRLKDPSDALPTTYPYTGDKSGNLDFTLVSSEKSTKTGLDDRTSEVEYFIYEATISLKGGESITISDLPGACEYEVIEKDPSGYTVESTGKTGTFASSKTAEVVFTNKEITPTPSSTPSPTPTTTTTTTTTPSPTPTTTTTTTPSATPSATPTPTATPTATPTPGLVVTTGEGGLRRPIVVTISIGMIVTAAILGDIYLRRKRED